MNTSSLDGTIRGRPYMTSDGVEEGRSAKSEFDFIMKGALPNHLMMGGGGSKKAENHLTSYMHDPYP